MIYKVRLNDDNQKIYNLVSWNAQSFSATLQLTVQGSDMSQIGGDFEHIEKLEVF